MTLTCRRVVGHVGVAPVGGDGDPVWFATDPHRLHHRVGGGVDDTHGVGAGVGHVGVRDCQGSRLWRSQGHQCNGGEPTTPTAAPALIANRDNREPTRWAIESLRVDEPLSHPFCALNRSSDLASYGELVRCEHPKSRWLTQSRLEIAVMRLSHRTSRADADTGGDRLADGDFRIGVGGHLAFEDVLPPGIHGGRSTRPKNPARWWLTPSSNRFPSLRSSGSLQSSSHRK